jgi:methylated-DNA-protein-cysteine methyltransferase-like protein
MRYFMPSFSSPPNPQVFNAQVWDITRQVPLGLVTTYGQIASMIPPPGTMNLKNYEAFGSRWVGSAMAHCPDDVPWQRVINSQGKISPRPGAERQREMLEAEGVEFNASGKVDFDRFAWDGPDGEWLKAHGLFPPKSLSRNQPKLF